MKILNYDERPEDEKKLLRQIERYEINLDYFKNPSQKIEHINNIASEFTDLCSHLCKVIKGNLLKESLRNQNANKTRIN